MKTKSPTDIGMNRTGIQTSPIESKKMIDSSTSGKPSSTGDSSLIGRERAALSKQWPTAGTMPPPGTLKGAASSVMQALKGEKATVLLDKIGERLAFERTGARLYEAALSKFDAFGTWSGGPTEARLREILADELSHFDLLWGAMERLGGDPTALTPSANVAAVLSQGVPKIIVDPRMNMRQTLEALLLAEVADTAAWELLSELSRGMGQNDLADEFERCAEIEAGHLRDVRAWLVAGLNAEAGATAQQPGGGAPVQP